MLTRATPFPYHIALVYFFSIGFQFFIHLCAGVQFLCPIWNCSVHHSSSVPVVVFIECLSREEWAWACFFLKAKKTRISCLGPQESGGLVCLGHTRAPGPSSSAALPPNYSCQTGMCLPSRNTYLPIDGYGDFRLQTINPNPHSCISFAEARVRRARWRHWYLLFSIHSCLLGPEFHVTLVTFWNDRCWLWEFSPIQAGLGNSQGLLDWDTKRKAFLSVS